MNTNGATRKSLAEMNSNPQIREWGSYTLRREYAVARGGMKAGDKIHLLVTEIVTADSDPKPRNYKVGSAFSAHRDCNSNGQHTGRADARLDTDAITCSRCLRGLSH